MGNKTFSMTQQPEQSHGIALQMQDSGDPVQQGFSDRYNWHDRTQAKQGPNLVLLRGFSPLFPFAQKPRPDSGSGTSTMPTLGPMVQKGY